MKNNGDKLASNYPGIFIMTGSFKINTIIFTLLSLFVYGLISYAITIKDTKEYHSKKNLDLSDKRYVILVNASGQKLLINQDEILSIREI